MACCNKNSKGNIIIPPIIIMPPPPTVHRQVIPSQCPPQQIPMFIPTRSKSYPPQPHPQPYYPHQPHQQPYYPQPHQQPYYPQPQQPQQPYYPQPQPPPPHQPHYIRKKVRIHRKRSPV